MRECLQRYGGLVSALARRMSASPADADDACQDIFLELWRCAASYRESQAREVTFVAMIARRRLIDRHRTRPRAPSLPLDVPCAYPERLEAHVDARAAVAALDELEDGPRNAIVLSACYGLSHDEIAQGLALPLGTVKSAIRRGVERVRHALSATRISARNGTS